MKGFFRSAGQILKKNLMSLFLFELTFRVLGAVFLLRAGNGIIGLLLEYQGYSFLTADNFQQFAGHPLTVLTVLLLFLAVLLALLFESCGILACFERSWQKEKITLPGILRGAAAGSIRFLRRYPLRWIFYMAGAAPFLCLHLILWELSRARLAAAAMQRLAGAVPLPALGGILGTVFLLSMLYSFTLPQRLLRPDRGKRVPEDTKKTLQGRRIRAIGWTLLLQVLAFALVLLLFLAVIVAMTAGVRFGRNQSSQISAVLVYGSWIRLTAGVAAGGAGMTAALLASYTIFAWGDKAGGSREASGKPGWIRRLAARPGMLSLWTAMILAADSLLVLVMIGDSIPERIPGNDSVAVTAHRGGARVAPENTLSAMEAAVESLADYAEIDVQETKDGEIVLLHDTNLKRVTGLNANIWDLTYEEVSRLDAGVKFHKKFRGEQIPTLGEVLDYCRGKIRLNIELKYNGHNGQIVPKVVKIIEEHGFEDSCVVTSMNYRYLEQIKELAPDLVTGYTLSMVYGDLSQMTAADFFSVKYTYLNRSFVRRAHALGKEVCAWTLNYQGDIQRMIDCGVDNLITDDPEMVRRVTLGETGTDPSFGELLEYALR